MILTRAEKIRKEIEKRRFIPAGIDADDIVTISLGIYYGIAEAGKMEDFIRRADDALYQAKKTGKNQTVTGSLN